MAIFGYEIKKVGSKKMESPYLSNHYRLADIIAALQIMGSYKFASRKWDDWENQLDKPKSANNWLLVFKEHPEFFRVSHPDRFKKEWVSLRWRHGYDKNYWIEENRELSEEELQKLEVIGNEIETPLSITRKTLDSSQIESLINTAIELHGRAIAYKAEKRWLLPFIIGIITAIGAFVGTILAAIITK